MKDIRTVMKPIKIGDWRIEIIKVKTVYDDKHTDIHYHTLLKDKDGFYINKNGDRENWSHEAYTLWFFKNEYDVNVKEIERNWRIELSNHDWSYIK